MKKFIVVLLTILMLFSLFQGALKENVVKADETNQWVPMNNGLLGGYIKSLAIDPANTNIIYAVTLSDGIFKSTDSGSSWTAINKGLPYDVGSLGGVGSLAIDPTNTNIIYAGTYSGVFKSTDGGASWTKTGLAFISSLVIDSKNTQTIYAGMVGGGVFKYIVQFTITTSAGLGGSISPSGTITVNYGDTKNFTMTPNSGYKISNVKIDGVSKGSISSFTFTSITSNNTIEAVFEKSETVIILQVGQTSFTVDGVPNTLDSPPIIKNSRTLLPIRAVVEALGGNVDWDVTEKKVTISLGSNTIELWIGKSIAKVNGADTPIDSTNSKVVPEIINGRTMLPLRFVTENLGCDVQWDGTTKTITITYSG